MAKIVDIKGLYLNDTLANPTG
ncbi:hypothetical protein ACIOWE_29915, partial [Pseudomonas sp. NPDC087598]